MRFFVPSGAHVHPAHTHTIGSHTHRVNAHTHQVSAHTHTVSAHTHTVQNHTHDLEFGIYEGQRASKARIRVDGNELPEQDGYDNIDIVAYLSKDDAGKIRRGTWHTVEILPELHEPHCRQRLRTGRSAIRAGGGDY